MGIADSGLGLSWGTGNEFYDSVMNKDFRPYIADVVINPNTLLSRLNRRGDRLGGKGITFPVHYGRNEAVGSMGFDGSMPEAQAQKYKQYNYFIAHMYGRVKIDGLSDDMSQGSIASWLEARTSEMEGLARDFARYRQRAYWMNGSGTRAYLTGAVKAYTAGTEDDLGGAAGAGTLVFPTDYPESTATPMPDQPRLMWFSVGELIGLRRTSDGVTIGAGRIVSISDSTASTALLRWVPSNSFSTAATTYAVVRLTSDDASYPAASTTQDKSSNYLNDPMGIGGVVDDSDPPTGDFQGIDSDAAANSWHRANIKYQGGSSGAAAAALTLAAMDETFGASVEIGDAVPSLIIGNFPVVRKYAALLIGFRRYINTDTFDGGWSGLDYNGIPVIADRDSMHNRLFFLVESDLGIEVAVEPQWWQRDRLLWRLANNDTDFIWAAFYCRENLSSMTRHVHSLLTQIDE